jgi:site-specific DNA-methyltransferase (adenine-specific)
MRQNTLFYGDNIEILRKHIADESVDLVYLDPPFNSNRDYNVIFKEQSGAPAQAQVKAFGDTWRWSEAAYAELRETCPRDQLVKLVEGFIDTLGRNDVTAYLVMMAPRLVELHRVLKSTGSLYLHCDPTASHYLKLVLDRIFGPRSYRNEIIWRRTNVHSDSKTWSRVSDTIFFYTKSDRTFTWNPIYTPHSEKHIESKYTGRDPDGRAYTLDNMTSPNPRPNMMYEWKGHASPPNGWRYSKETMARLDSEGRIWYPSDTTKRPRLKRYLEEMPGTLLGNVWTDISPINSQAGERLGYPTQKPLLLLERIVKASSNPGDVVLDPFCGCGTATVAAHKLGRNWIGIDITNLAVTLIKARLADAFDLQEKKDYAVIGEPISDADARSLAEKDKYEFQKWAVGLVPRAYPYQTKKGADGGIDGILRFLDDPRAEAKRCVIQVKGGKAALDHIRDLRGVMEREKATLGFFICLDPPTKAMQTEADSMGFYTTVLGGARIPRLQIRTVGRLLAGESFQIPAAAALYGVRQAVAVKEEADNMELEL